jgi:Flp pilus assembly protein TadG
MHMARRWDVCRQFLRATRGLAAVEFAIVFPMLLLMLLASIDAGRAIAVYMKVRAATYALDAMANQYTNIQDVDLQTIEGAAAAVISPYASGPVGLRMSQVEITTGGPVVAWSDGLNMTAYAKGYTGVSVPTNLAGTSAPNNACAANAAPGLNLYMAGNVNGKGCYLLLAQVQYTYTPMFGAFITGPITLSDSIYMTPRNSLCVVRNNGCYNP